MRIILWLAAGAAAAAGGGAAAAAEIARGSMVRSGSAHGAWKPGGFGHGFKDVRPSRRHPGRGGGHRDRLDRHRGHHWNANPNILHSYGGGIDYSYQAVDPHGSGFFAGGGGEVLVRGGRPHYDYDRSYPYEWAPSGRPGSVWIVDAGELAGPGNCSVEKGVRVCRGGR